MLRKPHHSGLLQKADRDWLRGQLDTNQQALHAEAENGHLDKGEAAHDMLLCEEISEAVRDDHTMTWNSLDQMLGDWTWIAETHPLQVNLDKLARIAERQAQRVAASGLAERARRHNPHYAK